jgi:phage baseplate assembly protein W
MATKKFINIKFPFENSQKGFFLELTETDKEAIKADLMHLILTAKGERFYLPNFGTNLIKFIFEPNDGLTESKIKEEISDAVNNYLPNLKINEITIDRDVNFEYKATVRIDYTITEDVFEATDFVIINI